MQTADCLSGTITKNRIFRGSKQTSTSIIVCMLSTKGALYREIRIGNETNFFWTSFKNSLRQIFNIKTSKCELNL